MLAACCTILVVMLASPGQSAGKIFITYLGAQWDGVRYWLSGLF